MSILARSWRSLLAAVGMAACTVLVVGSLSCPTARAQQVTISAPFQRVGDSYSENIGASWGFQFHNGFFRFGGGPMAPAGQVAGGAGATIGFNRRGADFLFHAGQGSRRSLVSQTPSVTILNGGTGIVSETTQQPFVIGVVPVVGGAPIVGGIPSLPHLNYARGVSPIQQRLARLRAEGIALGAPPSDPAERPVADVADAPRNLAEAPAASVASIEVNHARQRRLQEQELAALVARAERAQAAGRVGAAKIYYQMAVRRADDAQRDELNDRLSKLQSEK